MKKVAESCQQSTTTHQAGNTSQTGNSVLNRTLKNTPENERLIRGVEILESDISYLEKVLGKTLSSACLADGTWVVV